MPKRTLTEGRLRDFLKAHERKPGEPITMTSMTTPKGSFTILEDDRVEFFRLYNEAVDSGFVPGLIERHLEDIPGPIVVDFDVKIHSADAVFDEVDKSKPKRLFIDELTKEIVKLYQNKITDLYNITDLKRLTAYVFLRPNPYIKGEEVKDGIHLMFPGIPSSPESQMYLRELMIKDTEMIELLKGIPGVKQSAAEIIDKSVIKSNGWMLYGSSKPGVPPYILYNIFDHDLKMVEEFDIGDYSEAEFFSIQRFKVEDEIKPADKYSEPIKHSIEMKEKARQAGKVSAYKKKHRIPSPEDIEMAVSLVKLLDADRADDYFTWMEVGWSLHNMDPNNEELYNIWHEFSKQSSKYSEKICHEVWHNMKLRDDGYTLGSLRFWASLDDPEGYSELVRGKVRAYLEKTRDHTGSERSVAEALHQTFGDLFVYVPGGKKNKGAWYVFQNHRWVVDGENLILMEHIMGGERTSSSMRDYYRQMVEYNNEKIRLAGDDQDQISKLEEQSKYYMTMAEKLEKMSFVNNVIGVARMYFRDAHFYEKLDSNPFLLGFDNGVYDLENFEFREGRPNDFISASVGYDYVSLDENSDYIDDINIFMEQVLTNKDVREYVWKTMASFLDGVLLEQRFRFWTGTGGNGKSKLNDLLSETLGSYACKVPITLFTGKRTGSSQANPELAQIKGKRYIYVEESDKGDKINVGLLKELTGGDKISCRDLFESQMEFKPQGSWVMFTNHKPEFPPDDGGMNRRVEVVEFTSRFVDKPNPARPNEFKKDGSLDYRIKEWKTNFMALLLQKYSEIQKEIKIYKHMIIPDIILKYKDDYMKSIDPLREFLESNIIQTKSRTDIIRLEDLYSRFVAWLKDQAGDGKRPDIMNKKDFKVSICKTYNLKARSLTMKGFAFIEEKEEVESEDEGDEPVDTMLDT